MRLFCKLSALSFILFLAGVLFSGCARRPAELDSGPQVTTRAQGNKVITVIKEGKVEKLAPVALPEKKEEPKEPVAVAPPELPEVEAAVKRIFHDLVTVDTSHSPAFVSGEFNGDSWQDLAVVVRAGKTETAYRQLNDEYPNWTIIDPTTLKLPDPDSGVNVIPTEERRPRINKGETLVAVIHGYNEEGWRNPKAFQSYLLKGVAGTGLAAEQTAAVYGAIKDRRKLLFRGHQVIADKIGGRNGVLFWAGGTYAWFADSELKNQGKPIAQR